MAAKATGVNAVGLGGMLFLLLRLLAVAHYDWHVAFSLADAINFGDVIGVVVGTFLGAGTFTGLLLALLLPLAVARHVHHIRTGRWRPHQSVFIAVLGGVFAAALITLHVRPALLIVLAASAAFFTVMWRQAGLRPYLNKVFAHMGVVGWAAFLALGGLTDTVWVPEQRIGLRDGTSVTGYVMNVQSPYTEVLTEHGRDIRELLSGDVVSRTDVDG
ncbi:hypothetical protein [Actinomadura verrucosospora]|uniref:Uncharacterized protein n=1 Tax=Actinomadura verrucosospora TaxID=46165 RepID=A0A7D3ZHX3_ACTVE|nr:hypothetical protein [Actinomadura verrucosospora]QKG24237.1 hypothetical protein ACTIVE_5880 [Actinomadura verrucosospora]